MIMNIRFLLFCMLSIGLSNVNAQMRFGISDTLNPSAVVQIDTGDGIRKGLLMPRLALKSADNFAPLGAHVQGMVVYNTVTAGIVPNMVYPGHYYNDGTKWNRILSDNDISKVWMSTATGNPAMSDTQNAFRMGKIAIGHTTPTEQLDVTGNIKAGNGAGKGSTTLKSGTTTNSGKLEFTKPNNTQLGSIGGDTSFVNYKTNDSLTHHVFTGGNIGIGTSTPPVKLEVNGAIKLGNEAATTAAPSAGMIRFNTANGKFQGFNGTIWLDLNE
jgi:hypothetical protein